LAIGFDGMAVSLLGSGTSIGILLSALLFSILKIGGLGMQTGANIPFEIVNVSIALIIFFVGINYIVRVAVNKLIPVRKDEGIEAVVLMETALEPNEEKAEGGEG